MALLAPAASVPAHADVSAVSGGAFGVHVAVGLFGGPTMVRGDGPADAVVELPSSGSATPIVDAAPTGVGQYGPAVIFQSGPLIVSTTGDRGDVLRPGYVKSSATVNDIG